MRLEEFYNLFETVEFFNEDLKKTILKTWLLQFLGSAYDKNFKAQGILVLKGKQGMKKTTSMEYLIPIKEPWVFLSEQKFVDSRDGVQTITSNQLVELSEFARSAKEVDALKGFVTAPYDKYVLKYAPNPEAFKRYTIYYATINDDEFLIDIDNRRFWVLDLISMKADAFKTFDFNNSAFRRLHLKCIHRTVFISKSKIFFREGLFLIITKKSLFCINPALAEFLPRHGAVNPITVNRKPLADFKQHGCFPGGYCSVTFRADI